MSTTWIISSLSGTVTASTVTIRLLFLLQSQQKDIIYMVEWLFKSTTS